MKIHFTIVCLLSLSLLACSRQPHSRPRTMTAESHPFSTTLFYSGVVEPLKTIVITSPAEGVVIDMPFQYGEQVKAGQLLFTLSSSKFLAEYKNTLMQYVKAKSDFNNSQTQLTEAKFLHNNQLISDDEFKTKQSNFYSNRLALLQEKDALTELLQQLDVKGANLYSLTIADIDKITQALHLDVNSESLRILSPAVGIILSPIKTEEENKKLLKGDTVKQGDVLAVVSDTNGMSIKIKVNELTINQLQIGQKVKVTGVAFPEYILAGEITRIDKQGESSNAGMPTFSVVVAVPTLSVAEQNDIHIGMSAKVEIDIENQPQVTVPITAVTEKNGAAYLQIYDPKKKVVREVPVKTGQTTADAVAILSKLKPGEQIVIPD